MRLHHIGIAVANIQSSLGEITNFINFDLVGKSSLIGSQKVNICFLKTGNIFLELIEPTDVNSPISNFVKNGGGIHHLCFEVKDVYKTIDEMIQKGGRVIVEPVIGFEGRLIAFVMLNMKNTKCNLIEFAEERSRLK